MLSQIMSDHTSSIDTIFISGRWTFILLSNAIVLENQTKHKHLHDEKQLQLMLYWSIWFWGKSIQPRMVYFRRNYARKHSFSAYCTGRFLGSSHLISTSEKNEWRVLNQHKTTTSNHVYFNKNSFLRIIYAGRTTDKTWEKNSWWRPYLSFA
jgi:hypothetical protein